jgi:pimeloyl-ACP methyl ester carboxylesterase
MVRKYGKRPLKVAVLHGGPGAPGYMAPVARELGKVVGVIEPLQTRDSLEGQIEELEDQLTAYADTPVTLIGSSWGAVLALFLAARKGAIVKKLILIGSAVFDAGSSARIEPLRLERLDAEKRRRYEMIARELEKGEAPDLDALAREWGDIIFDADVYDPLTRDLQVLEVQYELYKKVWSDFVALRDVPGLLKSQFSKIDTPAVVIHGEFDPHPIEGICPFLESCLREVRFYILPECGHYPWIERRARGEFFDILRREL